MSRPFVFQPLFLIQVWPDLELIQYCSYPPSFSVELTLSIPCSRTDPLSFSQDTALAYQNSLPIPDLVIWTDGFVSSPFAEAALGSLPTARFMALRPSLPFWEIQCVKVFLLKPAPFCKLSAGPGSTNNSAISLPPSSSQILILLSPSYFLLLQALWHIWKEPSFLSSFIIRQQWVPFTTFVKGHFFI